MTDRDLLELAAKAAGLAGHKFVSGSLARYWGSPCYMASERGGVPWNPLANDGDALRLAVKLRIGLGDRETTVTATRKSCMSVGSIYVEEGGDLCAATRRAIVRAAAEIGRDA